MLKKMTFSLCRQTVKNIEVQPISTMEYWFKLCWNERIWLPNKERDYADNIAIIYTVIKSKILTRKCSFIIIYHSLGTYLKFQRVHSHKAPPLRGSRNFRFVLNFSSVRARILLPRNSLLLTF